jgi:uncharacterized damage-inducible protein DinB
MNRYLLCLAAAALLCGTTQAQDAKALIAQTRSAYTQIKNNLTKAADAVPEADYSFQPVKDIRTLGALIGHIADAQMFMCSTSTGEAKRGGASGKTSKADLVAALKASFDECDTAFDKLSETNYLESVGSGRMQSTRLALLDHVIVHDNEEYGYMAVYLRLKGIVPPSSEHSSH